MKPKKASKLLTIKQVRQKESWTKRTKNNFSSTSSPMNKFAACLQNNSLFCTWMIIPAYLFRESNQKSKNSNRKSSISSQISKIRNLMLIQTRKRSKAALLEEFATSVRRSDARGITPCERAAVMIRRPKHSSLPMFEPLKDLLPKTALKNKFAN